MMLMFCGFLFKVWNYTVCTHFCTFVDVKCMEEIFATFWSSLGELNLKTCQKNQQKAKQQKEKQKQKTPRKTQNTPTKPRNNEQVKGYQLLFFFIKCFQNY